jgi:hypothetical protein
MPATLALALLSLAASPDETVAPTPAPPVPSLAHLHQVGISLAPGLGYRVIFPYKDGEFCGETKDSGGPKRVCTSRLPWFLELEAAFGVTRSLSVIADLRFGLEEDFNTSHLFFFAPGVKYFSGPDARLKFYTTFQLVFDNEDQHNTSLDDFDFGLRNANGLQFDFNRYVGAFAQFGETLAFVRWLRFELDFAFGVQGRFP